MEQSKVTGYLETLLKFMRLWFAVSDVSIKQGT